MLSWAQYLFGSGNTQEAQQDEAPQEAVATETHSVAMDDTAQTQEWIVVDYEDCSFGEPFTNQSHVTCYPGNHGDNSDSTGSSHSASDDCSVSPLKSDSDSSGHSKQSTPALSPVSHSRHLYIRTKHGVATDAWILTPPPCFNAGKKKSLSVGMSDMENLLIEHPSMSVYKRSGSEDDDSNHSEASLEEAVVSSKRSQAVSRQTPRRLRVVSARAQLLTQVQKVKVAQRSQMNQSTRRLSRNRLDLSNKVAMNERQKSRKIKMQRPSGQRNGRVSQRAH